jgi:methionyl aminopeptidase
MEIRRTVMENKTGSKKMIGRNDPCWCGSGKKFKKCHMDAPDPLPVVPAHEHKPANKFCKTEVDIQGMRKAGAFNGELIEYIRPFVKAGISTGEINTLVHEYTIGHGHTPATLGYNGYPKSCCVSINNVVCHGIPSERELLKEGDIVNVDCTTIVEGYFGDSSETFMLGPVTPGARHLVDVTARALIRGIQAVKPGLPLIAVAEAIEPFVTSQGCSVVRQYTGHGLGKVFHEHFTVYHHVDPDSKRIIMRPGMTFTIEPMINSGGYEVITDTRDKWTVRTKDGSLSAQFEHTVLVTETVVDVLTLTPRQRAQNTWVIADGLDL